MRHHGDMAATTCIHGFAPGQCLICQTLQGGGGGRPVKEAGPAKARPAAVTPLPTSVRPDAVLTKPASGGRSLGWRLAGIVVIVALIALVSVWIIGLAFAVLRIIELVATAVLAGWIGYHLGLFRGRHLKSGD
jgi:hypothetical protein